MNYWAPITGHLVSMHDYMCLRDPSPPTKTPLYSGEFQEFRVCLCYSSIRGQTSPRVRFILHSVPWQWGCPKVPIHMDLPFVKGWDAEKGWLLGPHCCQETLVHWPWPRSPCAELRSTWTLVEMPFEWKWKYYVYLVKPVNLWAWPSFYDQMQVTSDLEPII